MSNENTNKPVVKKPKVKKDLKKYFREVFSEVKKVSWPTKKELINYVIAAIVFISGVAIVTGIVDMGLTQLLALIS